MDGGYAVARAGFAGAVALALLLGACGGGGGSDVDQPRVPTDSGDAPHDKIALDNWALTLPVDDAGGTTGAAASVQSAELVDGYRSRWFYATAENGISFFAPVNGARTPNASYARSELRQMLDPGDSSVNWTWNDPMSLHAQVEVNQVPSDNGKVVVGQILGYNGTDPEISALAKLVFEHNGRSGAVLYALVSPSPYAAGSEALRLQLGSGARLNQAFGYTIRVADRVITFSAEGATQSAPITADWQDVGLYFRAGAALLSRGDSDSDGARVTFYALRVEDGR